MMTTMVMARRGQATPEFVNLCKTLYGDIIDAQDVWDDVAKASPDSADVSTHGGSLDKKRLGLRAAAITGGVVGGALGVREGREGIHEARSAMKLGRAVSRSSKKKLLISGTLGVTDSLDLGVLATEKNKRNPPAGAKPASFDKGVATEIAGAAGKVKDGLLRLWNPKVVAPPAVAHAPGTRGARKAADAASEAIRTNNATAVKHQAQGKDLGAMLSTKSGKAAVGTLGVLGAKKANTVVQNRKNAGMTYAPDDFGKSDEAVFEGEFSKFDDDKHLAFGWASVVSKGGHPVIDKQGDYISIEDIEEAAYSYVKKSRVGGDNHQRAGTVAHKVSDLVESMVFTDDKVAKMGLPDDFPRGWWVGFKVHDDDTWSEVRKGNRTGFSIHGHGMRRDQSVDEIMGYQP